MVVFLAKTAPHVCSLYEHSKNEMSPKGIRFGPVYALWDCVFTDLRTSLQDRSALPHWTGNLTWIQLQVIRGDAAHSSMIIPVMRHISGLHVQTEGAEMVRSFAASVARLRSKSGRRRARGSHGAGFRFIPRDDVLLDRVAPILVMVFLGVAAMAMLIQFTSSRERALRDSESALAIAAHLVEATLRSERHTPSLSASAIGTRLPMNIADGSRRFLLVDDDGIVRDGINTFGVLGQRMADILRRPDDFASLRRESSMRRVTMLNGEEASILVLPMPAPHAALVTMQPVDEELAGWRVSAYGLGGLLLCFGAVTIAFSLAYSAQRERALDVGETATDMQARIETALNRGRCGLWDLTTGSNDVVWSNSMWLLLGISGAPECVRISEIEKRLHADDVSPFALIESARLDGQREIEHLFRMRHLDGSYIWLRMRAMLLDGDANAPARLLGFVMDVTEERALEQEIHRADLRLRDAIESISEAFVLWDENNHLVMCNTKYQHFHGLPTELVQRGTRYRDLMLEARAPKIEIEVPRSSDEETGARAYEAQFQDGRWLLVSERPTRHGGFVSVGTDITARKLQEEKLVENERQLRLTISDLGASRETLRKQATQLAELADRYLEQKAEVISASRIKAEFLANMNHEIRTPLNAIIGFAEAMQEQYWGPIGSERYLGYAHDIHASGKRLLTLIEDVLDMAKLEAGRVSINRELFPLGELLAAAAEETQSVAAGKDVLLEVDPELHSAAGRRPVHMDPLAMRQALAHLLRNAIRLSPRGGRVSLRARAQGDAINIFIADSHCTLSQEDIGTMSDHFGHIPSMLENGCKGSGLGFPIAKGLIELHGGTLKLRSSPQIGTLVMVHLPIAQEPEQLTLPMPLSMLG